MIFDFRFSTRQEIKIVVGENTIVIPQAEVNSARKLVSVQTYFEAAFSWHYVCRKSRGGHYETLVRRKKVLVARDRLSIDR
jgi:hypothetical protein